MKYSSRTREAPSCTLWPLVCLSAASTNIKRWQSLAMEHLRRSGSVGIWGLFSDQSWQIWRSAFTISTERTDILLSKYVLEKVDKAAQRAWGYSFQASEWLSQSNPSGKTLSDRTIYLSRGAHVPVTTLDSRSKSSAACLFPSCNP